MVALNRRFRIYIILTVIIILCLIVITVSFRQYELLGTIKSKTLDFFKPIQERFFSLFRPVKNFINIIKDYVNLRKEYIILEEENSGLRKEYSDYVNLRIENDSLRKLLGIKLREDYETIAAKVIGFYKGGWQSEVILNAGSGQGVREGMGVINEDGLIGVVDLVGNDSCNVRLIDDPRSSIGAKILSSRKLGVLKGNQDGKVTLEYISSGEDVFKGDIVITSEYGNLPGEILIGRVRRVTESADNLYKIIEIEPFADFTELEYVLILDE
jgi:rod shape-determining protein MreC